ncbi:hypothetical protein [Halobacteriaceae bacterium SHR40]|uniref:hypothetical protein n=1 Tax=Halovenus amylolytica TaxID=2500550 RepID=UPI000FE3EDD3
MTNPLSTDSDTDIQEWVCPYCNQTRQSVSDIREHITESTEGEHRGVDGLKPTQDIVAFGPKGEVVDRVEGVSTEPTGPIGEYDKREIIVNSWLAGGREPDRKAVQYVSGASQQYVSQLLNDLDSGGIPRETWVEVIDYGLKKELEERLHNYEPEENSKNTPMNAQTTSAEDIVEAASKKNRIIAAHRVSPTADKNTVADALNVSYEYVRQIFNDIEKRDREDWKKLQEGDLEEDPDPELRDAVEQRLLESGAVGGKKERDSRDSVLGKQTSGGQVEGMVPASEIDAVLEKLELLQEQAEYTDNGDAEFVARKTIEWLDELIEQGE